MPVMPEDEPSDYLVTQAIADYLANRTEPVIDGIIYRSIQNGAGGHNVTLFHKSSRVEMLDIPDGAEVTAYIDGWSDDDPTPDYLVSESMPSENAKRMTKSEDDFFVAGFPITDSDHITALYFRARGARY